jgi:hypothetical protein
MEGGDGGKRWREEGEEDGGKRWREEGEEDRERIEEIGERIEGDR